MNRTGNDDKTAKTIAVKTPEDRARSPAWHRKGWNSLKSYQSSKQDKQQAAVSLAKPSAPPRSIQAIPGPTAQNTTGRYEGDVYTHHNRHTHLYSTKQFHTHRTTLHMAWVPGMNGAPAQVGNHRAFYGELDERLYYINQTLNALKAKAEAIATQEQGIEGDWDTVKLRHAVNTSSADQQEFFTLCMSEWCKLGFTCYKCQCKDWVQPDEVSPEDKIKAGVSQNIYGDDI